MILVAVHTYLLADPVTDQALGWLPLSGVTYSRRIPEPGVLNGTCDVTAATGDLIRALRDRPLALYAFRDAGNGRRALWWGGLVWKARLNSPSRRDPTRVEINAETFDSYPAHRRIWEDEMWDDPMDRGLVLADMWTRLQTGGSCGVQVPATLLGGDPWTGAWWGDQAPTWAEAFAGVRDLEPAIETTIDVWADDTGRHRTLRIGTPLIGDQTSDLLLVRPTTLQSWTQLVDHGRHSGTHGVARGATVAKSLGGDVVPIRSEVAINSMLIEAGQLRVDVMVDSDDTDDASLPARAAALVDHHRPAPSPTVTLVDSTSWDPSRIGDTCRVHIPDPLFDGGAWTGRRRIIGATVRPAEKGQPEEITLELHQDEDEEAA